MFAVGVLFLSVGYALAYHGIDVLAWSRSTKAATTRPVPLQYLLGLPLPTSPPNDVFHPPFTLSDTDAQNAVSALGGSVPGSAIANDPGVVPNSQVPPAQPGNPDPKGFDRSNPNQGVIPTLPGEGNFNPPSGAV